jgi:hypothetical protein
MPGIMIIDERGAGRGRVTYPGIPVGAAGGTSREETYQTIFHKPIIHILLANINNFFSFNQTGIVHRLQRLTQVIKIKEICVNLCNQWTNKTKRRITMTKTFRLTIIFLTVWQ